MDMKRNFMQAAGELFGEGKAEEGPTGGSSENKAAHQSAPVPPVAGAGGQKETSVLTADLTIIGKIEARGNVELNGTLKGDLVTQGDVRVFGKVTGNITGQNVTLLSGTVHGDIAAAQRVQVDAKSTVVGDISASDLTAGGRLKGNLKLKKAVTFESTALLLGNVEAQVLAVQEGAKLCGNLQMSHTKEEEAFPPAEEPAGRPAAPGAEKEKGR